MQNAKKTLQNVLTRKLCNGIIEMQRKLVNAMEELTMNREEILSKSKKENIYGDEREKTIRRNRDAFSGWGVVILGIVIMMIKTVQGQSAADIISLLFCMSGMAFAYEGGKLRNKVEIVAGIVLLLCAVYFFYRFCAGLF